MSIEHGWLIEAEEHLPRHEWLYVMSVSVLPPFTAVLDWTCDSARALRFARKQDAVAFAQLHPSICTLALITEHTWGSVSQGTATEKLEAV